MNTINIKKIITFLLMAFICVAPSYAADAVHSHGAHEQQGTVTSEAAGKYFHQSHIKGYHFSYELIDMKEQVKDLNISVTHHLMVFIAKDGSAVQPQKAGFLVTGPDGKTQKIMAMTMGSGSGADIDFSQKGEYIIKVKAVVNGKNLIDSILYKVE